MEVENRAPKAHSLEVLENAYAFRTAFFFLLQLFSNNPPRDACSPAKDVDEIERVQPALGH